MDESEMTDEWWAGWIEALATIPNGEPLGADFAKIWDENVETLYED